MGKRGREWRSRGWQVYLWQHFIMDDVNISWDRVPLCTVILMKVEIIEPVTSYQREPRHCSKTCKSFSRRRQNKLAQRLNSHHGRKKEKRQNKKTCNFVLPLSIFTDFERWNLSGNSNSSFNRKIDFSRKEISQYYCIEINVNIFLENKYRHKYTFIKHTDRNAIANKDFYSAKVWSTADIQLSICLLLTSPVFRFNTLTHSFKYTLFQSRSTHTAHTRFFFLGVCVYCHENIRM